MPATQDIVNGLLGGVPTDWDTWFQQFNTDTQDNIVGAMSGLGQSGAPQTNQEQAASNGYASQVQTASSQLQNDMNTYYANLANAANANATSSSSTSNPLGGNTPDQVGAFAKALGTPFGTPAPTGTVVAPPAPGATPDANGTIPMPGVTLTSRKGKDLTPRVAASAMPTVTAPGDVSNALGFYGYNPATVVGNGVNLPAALGAVNGHVPNPSGIGWLAPIAGDQRTHGGGNPGNSQGGGSGGSGM